MIFKTSYIRYCFSQTIVVLFILWHVFVYIGSRFIPALGMLFTTNKHSLCFAIRLDTQTFSNLFYLRRSIIR